MQQFDSKDRGNHAQEVQNKRCMSMIENGKEFGYHNKKTEQFKTKVFLHQAHITQGRNEKKRVSEVLGSERAT